MSLDVVRCFRALSAKPSMLAQRDDGDVDSLRPRLGHMLLGDVELERGVSYRGIPSELVVSLLAKLENQVILAHT
jgi:hypothetical protein